MSVSRRKFSFILCLKLNGLFIVFSLITMMHGIIGAHFIEGKYTKLEGSRNEKIYFAGIKMFHVWTVDCQVS